MQLEAIPEQIAKRKHEDGDFPVVFLGSHDYAWVNHACVMPWDDRPNEKESKKAKAAKKNAFHKAVEEGQEIHAQNLVVKAEMALKNSSKEKPPEFKKLKRNEYLCTKVKEVADEDIYGVDEGGECISRHLNIECTARTCKLGDACKNRRLQKRQWKKTRPGKTPHCGWGLFADEDIAEGDLVIEYIGEVMDAEMMKDRLKKCEAKGINTYYYMALTSNLFVDARTKASNARFVNHSCSPNCKTVIWDSAGEKRAGIFTLRDIPKGTELTYDYDFDYLDDDKKCQCHCGSPNCSGYIGVRKAKENVVQPSCKPKQVKSAFTLFMAHYRKTFNKGKAAASAASTALAEGAPVSPEGEAAEPALKPKEEPAGDPEEMKKAALLQKKEEHKQNERELREAARAKWDSMGESEQAPFKAKEAEMKAERDAAFGKGKAKRKAGRRAVALPVAKVEEVEEVYEEGATGRRRKKTTFFEAGPATGVLPASAPAPSQRAAATRKAQGQAEPKADVVPATDAPQAALGEGETSSSEVAAAAEEAPATVEEAPTTVEDPMEEVTATSDEERCK